MAQKHVPQIAQNLFLFRIEISDSLISVISGRCLLSCLVDCFPLGLEMFAAVGAEVGTADGAEACTADSADFIFV